MNDEPMISYSAKELLEGLRDEFRAFRSEVGTAMEKQDGRITVLEAEHKTRSSMREGVKGWIASGSAVVMSAGAIITLILTHK